MGRVKSAVFAGGLFALVLAFAASADDEAVVGRVVGVADGDTLTLLMAGKLQVKVRLAEIDAPEKAQPFGQVSKRSLSDLCFDREARLTIETTDRYGRTVARVECGGVDVNREQIRRGLAWAYIKYLKDPILRDVEAEAREARRGLWSEPDPMPPWEWRKR